MSKQKPGYKTLNQITKEKNIMWYNHYFDYLTELSFQLFEWENLPASVDPRFLERQLHETGQCAFYQDKNLGFIAVQGAAAGEIDHYGLPTTFNATNANYNHSFKLYNYNDMQDGDLGVLIGNNDHRSPSIPSLLLFASELTEIKSIIAVNQNAQKTPVLIFANDNNLLSLKNVYSQYEGGSPVIFADKSLSPDAIKVFNTDAPYVVDKLNTQKNAVWNELMTWLGIKNANQDKKERMITSEADSNDEQIDSSGNRFLKARQEAAKKINELYDLDIKVKFRQETIQEIEREAGDLNGDVYNPTEDTD